jgi:hypothetical protein
MRIPLLLVVAGLALSACTHNVDPKVTPQKIPTVQPPIASRIILLLTAGFEGYTTQEQEGIHHYIYHMGTSASKAITDLANGSFKSVDVEHVTDAQVLQWLSAPGDTAKADLLLVPAFGAGGTGENLINVHADVVLRLDVRSYRTGKAVSWTTSGHSARALSSRRGLTGNALERALGALTDSLTANRALLEATK